jgi:hypothetical protein
LLVLGCKAIDYKLKFYIKVIKSNKGWIKEFEFMILGYLNPLKTSNLTNKNKNN